MPYFVYKAVDSQGKTVTGTLEKGHRKEVLMHLRSRGFRPVTLSESSDITASKVKAGYKKATKTDSHKSALSRDRAPIKRTSFRRELVGLGFLERLLELHAGGMPLGDAVKLLRNRLSDPVQRKLAHDLWAELSEGRSLAAAMGTQGEYFSEATRYVIEAGENTGKLVPILERITGHLQEKADLRKKLTASLSYPIFIGIVAIGLGGLFVFFLLPNFQSLINSLGGQMTWTARVLIGTANFLVLVGPWLVGALFLSWLGIQQARRYPGPRKVIDSITIRLPLMGRLVLEGELFQLTSLMSTLMSSGINITETLRLSEKVLFNVDIKERFTIIRREVNEGVAFTSAARKYNLYPPLTLDILAVGENTGSLVYSMEKIAQRLSASLSERIRVFTSLLTTGALMAAFILVGFVSVGILSSIFQLSRALTF